MTIRPLRALWVATSLLAATVSASIADPLTTRVSVDSDENEALGGSLGSYGPALSGDGSAVAFVSDADDLTADDGNAFFDVFLRDRDAATTVRVSHAAGGGDSDGDAGYVAISRDGAYVAYTSEASNLIAGDYNGLCDAFVWERATDTTTRVSVLTGGAQGFGIALDCGWISISGDGRYMAFYSGLALTASDSNAKADIFLHDRMTTTTVRVSQTAGGTQHYESEPLFNVDVSDDGRYVVFEADDVVADIIATPDANSFDEVLRWDRDTLGIEVVALNPVGDPASGGSCCPAISADGRYVSFNSQATNLLGPLGDTNGNSDVFVRDMTSFDVERVSVSTAGDEGNLNCGFTDISGDADVVAFESDSTNLVAFPAFDTNAATDVFTRNRTTDLTVRVSVGFGAVEGDDASYGPSLSNDGTIVAFDSDAATLVYQDENDLHDVFVREPSLCGNGVLDPGEICDDGNVSDDDCCWACRPTFENDGCHRVRWWATYHKFVHPAELVGPPVDPFILVDRFVTKSYTLSRTRLVGIPSIDAAVGPLLRGRGDDLEPNLSSYDLRLADGETREARVPGLVVTTSLGERYLDTVRAEFLLVPASTDFVVPPSPPAAGHGVDRYKCYRVRKTKGSIRIPNPPEQLRTDEFDEQRSLALKTPKHLCLPVDLDGAGMLNPEIGLLCHVLKSGRGEPKHERVPLLYMADELATATVGTKKEAEICLPALVE